MKAKDLTQADVGKWVTLRGEILRIYADCVDIKIESESAIFSFLIDAILEFTTPPPPVQEVGDVFKTVAHGQCEWTLSAIVGDVCLLTTEASGDGGHQSANYPLNHNQWTPVK